MLQVFLLDKKMVTVFVIVLKVEIKVDVVIVVDCFDVFVEFCKG